MQLQPVKQMLGYDLWNNDVYVCVNRGKAGKHESHGSHSSSLST